MQPCPRCQVMPAWILGDGRFKCQSCGTRYSWKSVWDGVRLAEAAKERLLDAFLHEVPVYRQRFDGGACIDSRERFYRLARACCAVEQAVAPAAVPIIKCKPVAEVSRCMRGWTQAREVVVIGLTLEQGAVRIAPLSSGNAADIVALLRERVAIGGVYRTGDDIAFASLQVHGGYVVLQHRTGKPLATSRIENFWSHARLRLQALRKIPCRFLPLYLGEMSFRFNHHHRDQPALLRELLQTLSMQQLRPLIGDSPVACRRPGICGPSAPGPNGPGPNTSGAPGQFGELARRHIGMVLRGD